MKKNKLIFLFTIFSIFFCFILIGKSNTIKFKRLSLEDGLSQSAVYSIVQSKNGIIWFSTENGLNWFDGYDFNLISTQDENLNGLSHDNIHASLIDKNEILWIGTKFGGLNQYNINSGEIAFFKHDPKDPHSINSDNILCIVEDSTSKLWIGTQKGLNLFDKKTGKFNEIHIISKSKKKANNFISALFIDDKNNLWVGILKEGLFLKKNKSDLFEKIDYIQNVNYNPKLLNINSIIIDSKKYLWLGTSDGLVHIDIKTNNRIIYTNKSNNPLSLSNNKVWTIMEDRSGLIWIGTENGLNIFNGENHNFTVFRKESGNSKSLSSNIVRSLFQEKSGLILIGTFGGGVNYIDPNKKKFSHYYHIQGKQNSLSNNIVWSIYEDASKLIWIGTQGGGLTRINRINNTYKHYKVNQSKKNWISANQIRLVNGDENGYIWLGTDGGGLNRFNPNTNHFKVYMNDPKNPNSLSNNSIRSIYNETDKLWIGTHNGLNILNKNTEKFTIFQNEIKNPKSLSNNIIRSIIKDYNGTYWIGTYGGGLNLLDIETRIFKRYSSINKKITNDYIFTIYEDKKKRLWCGTENGLYLYNQKKDIFTKIKFANTIKIKRIYGILEDNEDNLWISSNKGLLKYNYDIGFERIYLKSDGLGSNEFNGGAYFKSESGELFFGGINGFNSFFPKEITDSQFIPPMIITRFRKLNNEVVFEEPVYSISNIVLSYKDYFFSIEFSALDYSNSKKNRYAYKLDGFDKDWIITDARKRMASYTNLNPGIYTFKVKGSNSDGVWNESPKIVTIKIIPPFWRTLWFKLIIFILFIFFVLFLYRIRVKKIKEKIRFEEKVNFICTEKKLTTTEKKILGLILQGKSNEEIEEILFISTGTIRNNISRIYKKLEVKNKIGLIKIFVDLK